MFVEGQDHNDQQLNFPESRLHLLLDRYANTIRLYVSLPPALSGKYAVFVIKRQVSDVKHIFNNIRFF